MAVADMDLIKKLRVEMGGIGLSDCKTALEESGNDYEEAVTWLRKKGIATAAKKASKIAAEGLVAIESQGNEAVLVEVNSETDFVAKNETFQTLAKKISKNALLLKGEIAKILTSKIGNDTVQDCIIQATATIGEKIALRRAEYISVSEGVIATYLHNGVANNPNLGQIGVLLAIETKGDKNKALAVGKQICMHIASMSPKFLDMTSVDPSDLEKEKEILTEQAKASGKPEGVIARMIEGRISKYYSDVVLLEQPFVMDPKITVKQLLADKSKDIGAEIALKRFVCFKVGEGIEKNESNFADEVAGMLK
jgi:elongation factor Ts